MVLCWVLGIGYWVVGMDIGNVVVIVIVIVGVVSVTVTCHC